MAASVKIEFDDGSRVISQTLEDSQDPGGAGHGVPNKDQRPATCSIDIFYEVLFCIRQPTVTEYTTPSWRVCDLDFIDKM